MKFYVYILTACVLFRIVVAQESVPDPRLTKILEEVRVAQDGFKRGEKERIAKYIEDLKALEKKVAPSGELDMLLQVVREREAWESGKPSSKIDPKDNSVILDLRKLRFYFEQELVKVQATDKVRDDEIISGISARLEELVRALTKEGRIPEAVEVRKVKEQLIAGTPVFPKDEVNPENMVPGEGGTLAEDGFDQPISGFDFGQPGKLNGFGVYGNGRDLNQTVLGLFDVLDVNADNGVFWNVLSRSRGAFWSGGNRRINAIRFARGELSSGGVLLLENGGIWHFARKEIDPIRYGGGEALSVAVVRGRNFLVLKGDGTVRLVDDSAPWVAELNKQLQEIQDAVAVDASHDHLFVLTKEGKVNGWRVGPIEIGERDLDLSGLGEDIVEIASSRSGVYGLDQNGEVRFVNDTGNGKVEVSQPRAGELKDIRRIWAGGDCGVALDKNGKLHAWAKDHADVGFVEKIEAIKGFNELAIMDVEKGDKKATHALWIERVPSESSKEFSAKLRPGPGPPGRLRVTGSIRNGDSADFDSGDRRIVKVAPSNDNWIALTDDGRVLSLKSGPDWKNRAQNVVDIDYFPFWGREQGGTSVRAPWPTRGHRQPGRDLVEPRAEDRLERDRQSLDLE